MTTLRNTVQKYFLGLGALFLLVAFTACGGGGGGGGDGEATCTDADADGYFAQSGCGTAVDCNDGDAAVNPGAAETLDDGIDQDCDGGDLKIWYADSDGDGYGDNNTSTEANSQPAAYVADNTDCDDGNPEVNPGKLEIPYNGIDDDCSTDTLDDDLDEDGYSNATDCDDDDPALNPGAEERCNDYIDNDCDNKFDCGDEDCSGNVGCVADFYNSLGMGFNSLPDGSFTMGSPSGETGRDADETEHSVALSAYYIQTTEVTQGQWQALMGSNPSYFPGCGADCPVEQVSWNDVQDFITALNDLGEGTYRLPTEAEWEYASRAGSTTAFASGGITTYGEMDACNPDANLNDIGWYCYNCDVSYSECADYSGEGGPSCAGINPVAQKQANAWGLYDMHGNVWEWCQDWYGTYPAGPVTDPSGPGSGANRIVRGGAWTSYARLCRSANRGSDIPSTVFGDLGFRLVVSPP